LYYYGGGTNDSGVKRELIESELMEKYHWLPQDIAKIPYKKIQKILLIGRQRMEERQTKAETEKAKREFYDKFGKRGKRR